MKIEELLADHQPYHSELQMDCFITARAGGITAYGRYKQALRELHKRDSAMKQLLLSKELLQVDCEDLQAGLREKGLSMSVADKKRADIKIRQKVLELQELELNIADTRRELEHFHAQAVVLKKIVGELNPERRRILDEQMWRANIYQMAAIDMMFNQRLSPETLNMILTLPKTIREQTLTECSNAKGLIEWLQQRELQPPADDEKAWLTVPCKCKESHEIKAS